MITEIIDVYATLSVRILKLVMVSSSDAFAQYKTLKNINMLYIINRSINVTVVLILNAET